MGLTIFSRKKEEPSEDIQGINYTLNDKKYRKQIEKIMKNDTADKFLLFTTKMKASIRTKDSSPNWTKQYTYHYSDDEYVNKEIEKLLNHKTKQIAIQLTCTDRAEKIDC